MSIRLGTCGDSKSTLKKRREKAVRKLVVTGVLDLLSGAVLAANPVPLSGEISVTTSSNRRSAVVTVSNKGTVAAQFCLSFAQALDQPISISAKGHVIYLPQPIEGLPPGVQISGPEPVAQTLAVQPEKSPALAFVAKGAKPLAKDAKTVVITNDTLIGQP